MKNSKIITVIMLVFGMFAFMQNAKAENFDTPATKLVKNFYDQLQNTMMQGDKLGFTGRFKKLEPVVKSSFNLPLMARLASGQAWNTAQPEEQKKLVDAFSEFSVATYASRFVRYDGEKFEVLGEKPSNNGGIIVETKLTPNGDAPVTLNYMVRPDEKGEPRIVDVFLDATISELATRRSEFVAVIKRDGFSSLINSLNEKSKKLGVI